MRKLISIALVLLCCKNMFSQSAGWQWVNSKIGDLGFNGSIANDNMCNLYTLSSSHRTYTDTLFSKFSEDGKCAGASLISSNQIYLGGKIRIKDSILKAVILISFTDTLIIGKDTIIYETQPMLNKLLFYIELNTINLNYLKIVQLARPSILNNLSFLNFEILNDAIILGCTITDSLIFNDGTYFTIDYSKIKSNGAILKYNTKKNKIEWKTQYNTDSSIYINSISKVDKYVTVLGFKTDTNYNTVSHFIEIVDSNGTVKKHKNYILKNAVIDKIISNKSHIYISGFLNQGTSMIDNKVYSQSRSVSFIAELDSQLIIIWLKKIVGNAEQMAIDNKDIITILGEFGDSLQYGNYGFHNPFYGQKNIAYQDNMFFMRLNSKGDILHIEHHEVPFLHHAGRLSVTNNDIFFTGSFQFQRNPYTVHFGNISIPIDTAKSMGYNYIARYTVSKLFFNIYLGTCKDSITVEHDPDYTTFNWFLNDTIYVGSDEKIKWNTNYQPGKYNIKVVASGANVCDAIYNDTLTYVHPLPPVYIGSDTSICINDSLILSANIIGNYSWNTNDTTQSIITTKAGKYYVTVYDSANCFVSDTININYFPQQKLNLGNDLIYCIDSGLPQLTLTGYKNYLWSTGETSPSILIKNPAEYSVLVTDSFNCKQTDTIEITEVCPPKVYVPNSFTPNNDGLNDIFKPSASFVDHYTLSIYNKWGELLYTGTEKDEGWNGKYRNSEAKEDVYIWFLHWTGKRDFNYDINGSQQGTVTLIRKGK